MKKNCMRIAAFGAALTFSCFCAHAQGQNDKSVEEIHRGVDGIDASVHAGVDEGAVRAPDQPQAPAKPPATYSRWGIQPLSNSTGNASSTASWNGPVKNSGNASNNASGNTNSGISGEDPSAEQLPDTRYWPAFSVGPQQPSTPDDWSTRTKGHTANAANRFNYEKPAMQLGSYSSLEIGQGAEHAAGTSVRKTAVPALPQPQQPDGLSSPFRGKQFGETSDTFSGTSLFSVPTFSPAREQLPASRRKKHPKEILDNKHPHAAVGLSNGREKPRRSLPTSKSN